MKKFIAKCYEYLRSTTSDIHPRQYLEPFQPLTQGSYNVYSQYPKFILDNWAQRMQDIHQEETTIVEEQKKALALKKELDKKLESKASSQVEEERLKSKSHCMLFSFL